MYTICNVRLRVEFYQNFIFYNSLLEDKFLSIYHIYSINYKIIIIIIIIIIISSSCS